MRIAFYAPLKPPDHPVPSGDRLLARLFVAALRGRGHDVDVVSRLRMFEGAGDATRQRRLAAVGAAVAQRLLRRWQRAPERAPALWFTYHLYHKAPDVLGPIASQKLRIPYIVAEASHAPRQREGRWREGHAAAEAAVRAADALVCLNPEDVAMLDSVRAPTSPIVLLPPFIDVDGFIAGARDAHARALADTLLPPGDAPLLACVAMMRPGDKLASFRLLADALARLSDRRWRLVVVGDGRARDAVHAAFAALPQARIRFAGVQPAAVVAALVARADLYVWPAVAEVIGLAMLEAQACGVPVIAGRRPGSAAMIVHGETGLLVPPGDAQAFAEAVATLLDDPARHRRLGAKAARHARERHALAAAGAALDALFARVVAARERALR